jgi:tetratricopeptide (TPR) repeat protein
VYSHRDALAEYALALADGPPVRTAFAIHSARADLLRNLDDSLNWAQALTDMQTLAATLADPALSVELAVKQAVHHFDSGRHADALWVATDARARLHGQLDPVTEGYLLLEMGAAQKALGQLDDAEALLREALGRFEGRVALKHGNAAFWLCLCAIDRGDLDRAAHWSQVAVEASAAAGYRRGHAMSLWTQSEVALLRGDQGSAIEILERALAEAREIGSVSLQVELLNTLVARLEAAGRADLAAAQRERIAQLQAAHGR